MLLSMMRLMVLARDLSVCSEISRNSAINSERKRREQFSKRSLFSLLILRFYIDPLLVFPLCYPFTIRNATLLIKCNLLAYMFFLLTSPKSYANLKEIRENQPDFPTYQFISVHLSEKVWWDMSFIKRRWLSASVGLVVLLCVSLGAFLAWRANQPVEPKTVYVMPEPNPERAEIFAHASQPHTHHTVTRTASSAEKLPHPATEANNMPKPTPESTGIISVDLEQKQVELDKWATDFKAQFPSLSYPQAVADNYQQLLDRVSDRYQQLQNLGFSEDACKKRLVSLAEAIAPSLMEENKTLYINMMRESIPLSIEVNRYLHTNELLPLPNYLLGRFAQVSHHDYGHNH